jgi:hypothetical protein
MGLHNHPYPRTGTLRRTGNTKSAVIIESLWIIIIITLLLSVGGVVVVASAKE